ncbi:hypothetical protein FOA43_001523 [Brettanomyces nanus]|uniref:Uncharacterized protein n=1 Tax=Eeniella nana TaxID=13502 RepID=A0A875S311_EENNA|nr:uncharacterized protein FOA43_001523 [Brettanomyces nanus]QPG74199.1 hypothetical protein FOA43_001523 [Brettanomyces nanus]
MTENVHYYHFFGRYFTSSDMVLVLAAFFFPPLSVYLQKGWSKEFLVSFILTALAQIPGLIYSLYLIWDSRHPDVDYHPVANDVEASQTPPSTPHDSSDPAPFKSSKPAYSDKGGPSSTGSSNTPAYLPPSYDEATKNAELPQTGDFKVQK